MSTELLTRYGLVPNSAKRVGYSLAYVSFLPLPDLFAVPSLCVRRKDTPQKDSELFFCSFFFPPKEFLGKKQIRWGLFFFLLLLFCLFFFFSPKRPAYASVQFFSYSRDRLGVHSCPSIPLSSARSAEKRPVPQPCRILSPWQHLALGRLRGQPCWQGSEFPFSFVMW